MRAADGLSPPSCPGCPYAPPARLDAVVAGILPNVVPAWVLPFLRLRAEAGGDPARAWAALPAALPAGTAMPDVEEAAVILALFRLA